MGRPGFRNSCEELFMWELRHPQRKLIASLLSANPQQPVFPNVKHFVAYISIEIGDDPPSVQFPALLPSTLLSPYLGTCDLELWLDVVSQFTALQSLTLVTMSCTLDIYNLSLLGRLHDLRSLVIVRCDPKHFGWDEIYDAPFTESDIEAMTSGTPLLQHLELSMPCEFSLPAPTSLATNCPRLKTCNLALTIPIEAWGAQQAPDFPHLETLILTQGEFGDLWGGTQLETKWSSPETQSRPAMKMYDESVVDPTHVDIVLRRCPRLEKLHLYLKDYGRADIEEIRRRMAQSA